MEAEELYPLLERLDDNVDDLEEAIKPLQEHPLSYTANKLPVLDKAKLHVLTTYTLESLLFCYLRLQGINVKSHPISRELTRLKQYFDKIKTLETGPEKPNMTLDKAAAGRFIKHGLAGNDRIDLERAEQEAKEKAVAQLKASIIAKKDGEPQQSVSAEPIHNQPIPSPGPDGDSYSGSGEKAAVDNTQSRRTGRPEKPKRKAKEEKESVKAVKKQRKVEKQKLPKEEKERIQKNKESRKARRAAQSTGS